MKFSFNAVLLGLGILLLAPKSMSLIQTILSRRSGVRVYRPQAHTDILYSVGGGYVSQDTVFNVMAALGLLFLLFGGLFMVMDSE